MKAAYSAVIFDKDGVLVDSEYNNTVATDMIFRENGILVDLHYYDQYLGVAHHDMWNAMKEEFGSRLPESAEYYTDLWAKKRAELVEREGVSAVPGVVACVKALRGAGIPIAVASSSNIEDILYDIRSIGLEDMFDFIISGEECEHGKPEPEIFLKAAAGLKVAPEACVVFEDAEAGVKAARAAGMKCFGYRDPNAVIQNIDAADVVFSDFTRLSVEEILSERAGDTHAR